jgi:hypothetical protein
MENDVFQKWGTSVTPETRYTIGQLNGGRARVVVVHSFDDPAAATAAEAYLIRRWPGPLNNEKYAGTVRPTEELDDALRRLTNSAPKGMWDE